MKIAVLGAAQTTFGELWNTSFSDLLAQSQLAALADAKIGADAVDAIFTGNMCAGILSNQVHVGSLASSLLNLSVPSVVTEGACASGGLAIAAGIAAIESGMAKIVLVNGVEKMTDVGSHQVSTGLISAASFEWEQIHGATFPALNAMIARLYMHTYGVTRKELAMVSVHNHAHGALNKRAHLQKKITVDHVCRAPMIADPLTLLDCSPISDGAASLVLCHEDVAKSMHVNPPFIIGSASATDTLLLAERDDLLTWHATTKAAQRAYDMAGINVDDIDVVELHDGFSIVHLLALEDLGFCKKGEAARLVASGTTTFGNELVVNPSGGLKSRGHPVGATGVAQAVEIVEQLRGTCGARQVQNAKIGVTHNVGGCGATAVVHVFGRDG